MDSPARPCRTGRRRRYGPRAAARRWPYSVAVKEDMLQVGLSTRSAARRALSLTVAITYSNGIPGRWTRCRLGAGSPPTAAVFHPALAPPVFGLQQAPPPAVP